MKRDRHHPAPATTWALAALALTALCGRASGVSPQVVKVTAYPTVTRSIAGVTDLDRNRYFAMCDQGSRFDERMRSDDRVSRLLDDLNATFGRRLAPIVAVTGPKDSVPEDPSRPGHADLDAVRQRLTGRLRAPSESLVNYTGGRLDVAAHGLSREYPEFMGKFTTAEAERDTGHHPHDLPGDTKAAAELAALALEAGYSDFDRPAYYEPINEPHWSFIDEEHLASWHRDTLTAVRGRGLPVQVGGPCLPVAYFYRNGYRAFDGFKRFLGNTEAELDFYSFHVYDYVNWNGQDLTGRITSGLPIEGVLDLVQTHAVNTHGEPIGLVVSEHGGYITGSRGRPNAENLGRLLADDPTEGEDDFARVVRRRSVASHVLVSAAIANTLAFMDHPHVVRKAVPFILPETMGWDPKYYPTIYVPHGFKDRSNWVETPNIDFYRFLRDLSGRRVWLRGGDPDLQIRGFVDGDTMRVVVNNVSDAPHTLKLTAPKPASMSLRRYGRRADYTPDLKEERLTFDEAIEIAGREAVLISSVYDHPIPNRKTVEETPHYCREAIRPVDPGSTARFVIDVPSPGSVSAATVRIGVSRPTGTDPAVIVRVNGHKIEVPVEDAASRLDDGEREYATTKIVSIDPAWLRAVNRVDVGFIDDAGGAVGSVVIRAGRVDGSSEPLASSATR